MWKLCTHLCPNFNVRNFPFMFLLSPSLLWEILARAMNQYILAYLIIFLSSKMSDTVNRPIMQHTELAVPSSIDFSICWCKSYHVDIHRVRNRTPVTQPLKQSCLPELMNDFFYMKIDKGGIAMSHFCSIIECIFQPTIPISIHSLR